MAWRKTMPAQGRPGGAAVWGLILLGVLLAVLVLAVDLGVVWNTQAELRTVADAAVLAAAYAWAEQLSPWMSETLPPSAREAAYRSAARYVQEHSGEAALHLLPNPENDADGDIVFGFYDRRSGFVPARWEDLDSPWPNAVRLTVRRDRKHGNPAGLILGPLFGWSLASVQAQAVAVLERRISGFRCTDGQAVPLVPLALLSDPTGRTPDAWETQLALQGAFLRPSSPMRPASGNESLTAPGTFAGSANFPGQEEPPRLIFRLPIAASTTATNQVSSSGQPLSNATLPASPSGNSPNSSEERTTHGSVCVLKIGTGNRADTVRQVLTGLVSHDLDDPQWAGQFVIEPTVGYRAVACWPMGWRLDDAELPQLIVALTSLQQRQEVRIWPLFAGFVTGSATEQEHDQEDDQPTGWQAAIVGFVAARILHVEMKSSTAETYLEITLEPQLLVTRTAIVASDRPSAQASEQAIQNPYLTQPNPYLIRIQLAE
jgi:hypothetical protein